MKLHSSSPSTNDQLSDFQEKATVILKNFVDATKYRFGLFNNALTKEKYNFKQSMAITIAGDKYDIEQIQQEIQTIVNENPCVMFIWEASPSCKQAIKALNSMSGGSDNDKVNYKIVRLDDPWSEGNKIRAELGKITGKSSVPSIWIGGDYVGGYDAGVSDDAPGLVQMAFQGTLRPKLEQAGAFK